jgi:hypothetical protein
VIPGWSPPGTQIQPFHSTSMVIGLSLRCLIRISRSIAATSMARVVHRPAHQP